MDKPPTIPCINNSHALCYHAGVPSDLSKFLEEREDSYQRLEILLEHAERRGLKRFDRRSLVELGHLYRLAAADLARARYVLRSPLLSEYLNEIVGRAHHLIHRKRTPFWVGLVRFVVRDFPETVRQQANPILLAAALLLGASLVGGIAYGVDPDWGQLVLSQPALRGFERELEGGPTGLAAGIWEEFMPVAGAFIISNNIKACIFVSAGGLLFGLGTLAALLYNGLLLGVVGMMFLSRGPEYDLYFWAGVLPHGVLEIPAICIAGGAGFLLARGLLMPGRTSRGDALRLEGRTAMRLLGGVVLILIVAGLIEGFITPLRTFPPWGKIAFSAVLLPAFLWYIFRAGLRLRYPGAEAAELRTTTHFRLR